MNILIVEKEIKNSSELNKNDLSILDQTFIAVNTSSGLYAYPSIIFSANPK